MIYAERPGHKILFPLIRPVRAADESTFQDRSIRVRFVLFSRFSFRLENLTNAGIEIDWDRCSYVDPLGTAHRVIHSGTRFIERDRPQAATVIPVGSAIEDALVPVDHIEYKDGWKVNEPFRLTEITQPGGFYQGKTFRLLMAIKLGPTTKTYDFSFAIPEDLKRPK